MADVFAELDEVLRQERMEKLWKEHGRSIVTIIALTILATALMSGFRAWNDSVKSRQTAELITLLDAPEFPGNIKQAGKLDLRGGPKGIALLTAAGAFLDDKKTAYALDLYEKASADKSIPDDLRHLATLMSVRLLAAQDKPDSAKLLARLEPVWRDKHSPWRHEARIEAALLYAHQDQDYKKAREMLAALKEETALPESLSGRASALDHIYALREDGLKHNEKQD